MKPNTPKTKVHEYGDYINGVTWGMLWKSAVEAHGQNKLYPCEREIAKRLVVGKGIKEVASEINRSPKTVEGAWGKIKKTLNVNTYVDLVWHCLKNGYVTPDGEWHLE